MTPLFYEIVLAEIDLIIHGVLGALLRILIHMWNYGARSVYIQERWRITVHVALGAIAGYISAILVITKGWTNHLTALSFGYMAPSLLEHLLKKGELGAE